MELSSWPQIAAINQKNYYTYVTGIVLICLQKLLPEAALLTRFV